MASLSNGQFFGQDLILFVCSSQFVTKLNGWNILKDEHRGGEGK